MSRSKDHGCNPKCGLCQPNKRWKKRKFEYQPFDVQRQILAETADARSARSSSES